MKKKIFPIILFFLLFSTLSVNSQSINQKKKENPTSDKAKLNENRMQSNKTNTDSQGNSLLRCFVLVGIPAGTVIYGLTAWDWGKKKEWQWGNENWFAQNTDSGGADKAGHAFAHYLIMRTSYGILDYTEKNGFDKWFYSVLMASLIGVGIEVGDALSGKYGFSYEDIVVDFAGIGMGILLESFPVLDSFVGFSAEYWPSRGFRNYKKRSMYNFAGDYSGWKFMANFKLAGLEYIGLNVPGFLRYIMFDAGYYTKNFTKYDNYIGKTDKKRHWVYGISINLSEVVSDFYSNKKSTLCRLSKQPFNYYHIPIGYSHNSVIE